MLIKSTKHWDKIKHLIETINGGKKGDYEKNFMKIKLNSDDNLPLNKMLKLHMLTVIVRSVFEENGKYYPQVFWCDCLYEVYMLEYVGLDIWEEIDINKTMASKECDICHYWYFKDIGFKYGPYLCNFLSWFNVKSNEF